MSADKASDTKKEKITLSTAFGRAVHALHSLDETGSEPRMSTTSTGEVGIDDHATPIGPGQPCPMCGQDYGMHSQNCIYDCVTRPVPAAAPHAPLRWSKTPPAVPDFGADQDVEYWYWKRNPGSPWWTWELVPVNWQRCRFGVENYYGTGREWAGPIPLPEEDTRG